MKSKKSTLRSVCSALAVAAIALSMTFCTTDKVGKMLVTAADELNKMCPTQVDQVTRIDSAKADAKTKVFQYFYTVSLDSARMNSDSIKKYFEPKLTEFLKNDPKMKPFRDNNVTLKYSYRDAAGKTVYELVFTPDMYK